MPLFECSAAFYEGRPVLVLSAQFAVTPAGRIVRLKVRTLRDLAAQLGFGELDRSLVARHPGGSALVAGGSNGIMLEIDGRSPQVVEVAVPSRQWLDIANTAGSVHVVFLSPSRFRRDHLERAVARGRAFGGPVPMVSHDVEQWAERYTFLGRTTTEQPRLRRCTVVLDSCVLLDLERALAPRVDPARTAQTQSLVLQLIHMDVLPGGRLLSSSTTACAGPTTAIELADSPLP